MTLRICPTCHSRLTFSDHYYCSTCGARLSVETSNSYVPVKTKTQILKVKNSRWKEISENLEIQTRLNKIKKQPLVEVMVLSMLLGVCFIVYNSIYERYFAVYLKDYISSRFPSNANVKQPLGADNVIRAPFVAMSTSFSDENFSFAVPSKVDLFVEFNDANSILTILGKPGNPELNYPVFKYVWGNWELFENRSAFFSRYENNKYKVVFMFITKPDADTNKLITEFPESEYKPKLIGRFFVISNDSGLFSEIDSASRGVSLSLSKNSYYVLYNSKLFKEGFLRIFRFNDSGRKYLLMLRDSITSVPLTDLLDQFIKSGYNEVVVN